MQVQQLLGSVLQIHGRGAEIFSVVPSSRRARTEQQRQTLCVLVLFLPWTSWVLSFLKSPSVYPADAEQDAEAYYIADR